VQFNESFTTIRLRQPAFLFTVEDLLYTYLWLL